MTEPTPHRPSMLRRLGQTLGLVYPEAGAPLGGGPKRSRYGLYVSPRLDQDLDDLRRRLEAIERDRP